ncbi:uncharacterized protein MEPE_04983 [Melanopsichium pennsylvanicum]|uniref:Uncharacterized protein n=1 Tax=Melanopsichium pennsylvanicum TaxID=63383 RepID=A0AAJ4XNN2_9BASI|nr:uncharacterized protein MEPE_04983 [Melanopsichium pennsylvanicum]
MKSFAFVLSALVLAGGTTATTMPHFKQERYKVDPSGLMVCEGGYELFCSVTFQQLSIPRACFKAGFKVADAFDRRIDPLNGYISENKTNFVVKTDDTEEFTLTPPGYAPIKVALYNPNRPVQIQTYDEVNAITEYKQSHQGKEPPEGCLAVAIYTQKKGYSLGSQTTDAFTHCPGTDKPIDLEVYKELSLVHDLKDSKVSHGEAGLNPRSSSKKAVDPPSSLRVLDVGYNLYCDPKTKDMTTPRVCIKTGVDMSDAIDQTQSDWLEGFTNHDSTSKHMTLTNVWSEEIHADPPLQHLLTTGFVVVLNATTIHFFLQSKQNPGTVFLRSAGIQSCVNVGFTDPRVPSMGEAIPYCPGQEPLDWTGLF